VIGKLQLAKSKDLKTLRKR